MNAELEFLVGFGRGGDFGRFRAAEDLCLRRGVQVVIRTDQGLELGQILCRAAPGHARYLSRTQLGEVVRLASDEDRRGAERCQERAQAIFDQGRALTQQLQLPLEIVDVELMLDGQQAVVYHLRRYECDHRALVSSLSKAFDIRILMQNLTLPVEPAEPEAHGCGKPDCGSEGDGCTSCGSGGGCSSCGKSTHPEEIGTYLTGLRDSAAQQARVPLL